MDREITIQVSDDEARLLKERADATGHPTVADYVHALVANALDDEGLLRQVADEIDAALDDPAPRASLEDTFAELRGVPAPRAKSAG